jgi:copper resistance protein C
MCGAAVGGKRGAPVDSRSVDTRSIGRRPARHPLALPARLRILPLLAGVLLALAAVSPVLGHAELVSSDPADKAVLDTPPTVITLTFDEGVVGKSSFKLIGPGGDTIGTGGPANDGDDTMTLDGLALTPGPYTIEWTSVADDGDVERGTLTFTVNEPTPAPATPTPAPSQASSAPSAVPSPTPTTTPVPSPSVAPVSTSSTTDVLFPIIAALALIGVIGALLLRRNRAA